MDENAQPIMPLHGVAVVVADHDHLRVPGDRVDAQGERRPLAALVAGHRVTDAFGATVAVSVEGEPLEHKGGPGTVAPEVLEALEGAGHVAVQKGDADVRVDGKTAVLPGKHFGGGLGVEESVAEEPAHESRADAIGGPSIKCTMQTDSLPMSVVVHLPAELEKTIAAESAKAGMTISDEVAGRLVQGTASEGSKRRLKGPSLIQRWKELGLIGCRADITDPEVHCRRLREATQHRATD